MTRADIRQAVKRAVDKAPPTTDLTDKQRDMLILFGTVRPSPHEEQIAA